MSFQIHDCDEDLTTDAIPSPSLSLNKDNSADETIFDRTDKADRVENTVRSNLNGFHTKKTRPRIKKFTTSIPAQATIININNSKDVHVGDTINYNVNGFVQPKPSAKIIETNAIKVLKGSSDPVTREDLLFLASHIDETWQDIARSLGYSEGQIQQFLIDHKTLGIKEVIFQFLLDWIQNEPNKAIVGNLSNILWDNNQRDAVRRWSEKRC